MKSPGACALAEVKTGIRVRILEIQGGRGITGRLRSMGLYPGVEVEVVSGQRGGPVLIGCQGSRIVIGCGMASRVLVEPLDV